MASLDKVIIIGGGIGGLAAGLAMLRQGIDVEIYEQSSELKEIGAGIQISSNGTRVLHALGLEQALARVAVIPAQREMRLWNTGQSWKLFDLGAAVVAKYGTPHVFLHRGDLHALLAEGVRREKPDGLQLGRRCVRIEQSADGVEIAFEDGGTARGALALGADGIHSTVRRTLFGADQPVFTGCVAWRGLVPMDRLPPQVSRTSGTNWVGPQGHVLHYPVRRGELLNCISLVERDDWQVESWTVQGTTGEMLNDFRGWHPDVQVILENIDVPFKWALMVRPPMASWTRGRITLLGDACHPTLPFLGQGAVMSIEDAYVLAASLKKHGSDHDTAFARYEDARRERTAAVVQKSFEHRKEAFKPELADLNEQQANEWQQKRVRDQYDWLYTYDATRVAV